MELLAFRSYTEREFNINFWRTKTGLEVDFILADSEVAIEANVGSVQLLWEKLLRKISPFEKKASILGVYGPP